MYSRHTFALRKAEQKSTQLPVIAQAHRNIHRALPRANLHRWERGHPQPHATAQPAWTSGTGQLLTARHSQLLCFG